MSFDMHDATSLSNSGGIVAGVTSFTAILAVLVVVIAVPEVPEVVGICYKNN